MSEMMRETMNDKVYLVTGAAGFFTMAAEKNGPGWCNAGKSCLKTN